MTRPVVGFLDDIRVVDPGLRLELKKVILGSKRLVTTDSEG